MVDVGAQVAFGGEEFGDGPADGAGFKAIGQLPGDGGGRSGVTRELPVEMPAFGEFEPDGGGEGGARSNGLSIDQKRGQTIRSGGGERRVGRFLLGFRSSLSGEGLGGL